MLIIPPHGKRAWGCILTWVWMMVNHCSRQRSPDRDHGRIYLLWCTQWCTTIVPKGVETWVGCYGGCGGGGEDVIARLRKKKKGKMEKKRG